MIVMSQTSFVAGFKVGGSTARVAGLPARDKTVSFPADAQNPWKAESSISQPSRR
ncbi:hypothetical protein [Neoaquamicrobium sediminum]|uniref:hypothetical protein n=1 Tax=Neoaquamicrobium sediminum TaxID=1849104 RepID=UPI0040381C51